MCSSYGGLDVNTLHRRLNGVGICERKAPMECREEFSCGNLTRVHCKYTLLGPPALDGQHISSSQSWSLACPSPISAGARGIVALRSW